MASTATWPRWCGSSGRARGFSDCYALGLLIASQAEKAFLGRDGHTARLEDIDADGCVLVDIDLHEVAVGAVVG